MSMRSQSMRFQILRQATVLVLGGLALPALAEGGGDLKVTGFMSLVVGQTQGACSENGLAGQYDGSCTRYVADYAHNGVVTDRLAANRESRAGLQLDYKPSKEWGGTLQLTARPNRDQHLNLEWAYVSYTPSPEWKFQLGRKRIPLYYYSDFQDVGFAYNTIRPSPDVYGWDVVNYNGASVTTQRALGDWQLRAEAYAGSENSRKNPYSQVYSDTPLDIKWSRIAGLSVEVSRDWFTGRLSYTRSDFQSRDHGSGTPVTLFDGSAKATQDFIGLALNGDWDDWQWRSELGSAQRQRAVGYDARYYLATLGRVWGSLTLTGGLSAYLERTPYTPDVYAPVRLHSLLLALRYDLHKGGALKLQWDRVRDASVNPAAGSARVLSAAYDLVF